MRPDPVDGARRLRGLKILALASCALSLALLLPRVSWRHTLEGQVVKQSFVEELARGFQEGRVSHGLFPQRTRVEIYHPGPVAWAEELPLFSALTGALARITGLPLVPVGRTLSWVAFLALLAALPRLGRALGSAQLGWLWLAVAAWTPAFRIYGASLMPDLAMTAACAWAWVFAAERSWGKALAAAALAGSFKYFAVFHALGLAVWRWLQSGGQPAPGRDRVRTAAWLALACTPAVLFLATFLALEVPNPIQEYPKYLDGNHLGAARWGQLGFYARVFNWLLLKNPSVPGGFLILAGAAALLRGTRDAGKADGAVLAAWARPLLGAHLLFALIFSSAYWVHDYYGLSGSLVLSGLAAWALHSVPARFSRLGVPAMICVLAVAAVERTVSATRPVEAYAWAGQALAANVPAQAPLLWISERSPEASLQVASRGAWMLRPDQWEAFPRVREAAARRIQDPELTWAAFLTLGEGSDERGRTHPIARTLLEAGFREAGALRREIPIGGPAHGDPPGARLLIYRRGP